MRTLALTLLGGLLMGATTMVQAEPKGTLSASDYTEIQMLYAKYNYAFDSSNPEMYGSVFVPDGIFKIGADRTLKGRKEIGALATSPKGQKPRPKIFHISTNVLIEPSPEGAKGSSYVTLIDLQKNPAITGGGTYEDVIVRTAEGWRFKQRSYFAEATPAAPAAK
jgi:hypothetical protein